MITLIFTLYALQEEFRSALVLDISLTLSIKGECSYAYDSAIPHFGIFDKHTLACVHQETCINNSKQWYS